MNGLADNNSNVPLNQVYNGEGFAYADDRITLSGYTTYLIFYTMKLQTSEAANIIFNPIVDNNIVFTGTTIVNTTSIPLAPNDFIATLWLNNSLNSKSIYF